jgi:hypothetical protein
VVVVLVVVVVVVVVRVCKMFWQREAWRCSAT